MNWLPLRRTFLLIPFVLTCFALSPQARAVCQEGCLTNDDTVLGNDALFNNTGSFNTAIGSNVLKSNTTGGLNTAAGWNALFSNTTGLGNTATAARGLYNNTTGNYNTASGFDALFSNIIGGGNTAAGWQALYSNNSSNNTAIGAGALFSNTSGNSNTAIGWNALFRNIGSNNTAAGYLALYSNTTGHNNTANGQNAMRKNTTGSFNVALGEDAGLHLTTGSNNIEIGNQGLAGDANTIRIGTQGTQTATFIAGISGATVPTGVAVIVDADGHLGTITSSERFKDSIQPMDKASEAILALKPVTYRYKQELDSKGIPQFGLVAEEVEKESRSRGPRRRGQTVHGAL